MKTAHHFLTRGAHGKAALVPENEIDLCWMCHAEAHTVGAEVFAAKYGLQDRLECAREVVWGANRNL